MNRMQEQLKMAADKLCIDVEIGYIARLSDGRNISCQARFLNLGYPLGTLIFDWNDKVSRDDMKDLAAQGYGISTFSAEPPDSVFDIQGYIKMFSEWGWAGPEEDRPSWIIDIQYDDEGNSIDP